MWPAFLKLSTFFHPDEIFPQQLVGKERSPASVITQLMWFITLDMSSVRFLFENLNITFQLLLLMRIILYYRSRTKADIQAEINKASQVSCSVCICSLLKWEEKIVLLVLLSSYFVVSLRRELHFLFGRETSISSL